MQFLPTEWFILTPEGALKAFAQQSPDGDDLALQTLLAEGYTPDAASWVAADPRRAELAQRALQQGWIERLAHRLQGPDARLDDFLQHVISPLSGERRAVLASDGGFCLGSTGMGQDEAETLSAALADFSHFVTRQIQRGWTGANRYASFHQEASFLLPSYSFIPFWVDGSGYWLALAGEPLLNNPVLVELLWGLKLAGTRFQM
jgi:hypothetical protein